MTRHILASASAFALAALGASGAQAAGTAAGSSIVNTVQLNYAVGGVAQTAINASNTFVVDRKILLTVAGAASTTSVAPGQTGVTTTYTVTNTSNATLDMGLSVAQLSGGTAAHGGTDNFDVTGSTIYADTNSNGIYDAGTDVAITYLDEVLADTTRTVFIVSSVPASRINGDVSGQVLTAQALEGLGAGVQGAVVTQTSGANTAGMDTVFADTAGATDAAKDGRYSASGDYTVGAAQLTITKTSRVISDPINGVTNPKFIPGALIEYCIQVANAAGGASATSVAVSDLLPSQTTYNSAFGIFLNGTVTGSACNADGSSGGAQSAGTVTGTLASVAAGTTRTLYFRANVN